MFTNAAQQEAGGITEQQEIEMTRKQLTRAIWKQAEEMCIPAFMTPLWRATYGKKG
jgi:hypothetical protein